MMFKKRSPPTGGIRYLYLFIHILAGVLTAGVIVGFGQLYPMLLDHGVWREKCGVLPVNETSCAHQQALLSNMFNYGATISIFVQSPSGVLLDLTGPRITALIGLVMFVPGCVMFALSTVKLDMYLSGFLLISAGGPMVFVSIMSTANLFPKYSSVVLTMMNGSYGGGALVFLVFNFLYFQYHITLKWLFLVYSAMAGAIALVVLFSWPLRKYDNPEEDTPRIEHIEDSRFRSVTRQMLTGDYFFLLFLTGILVLKSNFYLSTSDTQLNYMSSDTDKVALYSKVFALMLPIVGFIVAPIGLVVDKMGLNAGLLFLVFLSAVSGVVGIIQILPLQILNFLTFSMYFPYIYAYWCTFLVYKFGFGNYGFLYGGVAIVAGVVNLAGTPLANIATSSHRLLYINVGLLAASVVFAIYPLFNRKKKDPETERLLPHYETSLNNP